MSRTVWACGLDSFRHWPWRARCRPCRACPLSRGSTRPPTRGPSGVVYPSYSNSETDLFQDPNDATPLAPALRGDLLQTWVTTRADLNEAEKENILKGAAWARRRSGGQLCRKGLARRTRPAKSRRVPRQSRRAHAWRWFWQPAGQRTDWCGPPCALPSKRRRPVHRRPCGQSWRYPLACPARGCHCAIGAV